MSTEIEPSEQELGRCAGLVSEIVEARIDGDFDSLHGNSDGDLLGAVDALAYALTMWKAGFV